MVPSVSHALALSSGGCTSESSLSERVLASQEFTFVSEIHVPEGPTLARQYSRPQT